jgi:hypothetical protein
MITFDDKTTEALEYVLKAEKIMAKLGHTKYSLSGMCSAAMRHDLEKEVCQLLDELSEARKQRNTLAEALRKCRKYMNDEIDSLPFYVIDDALAVMKGGDA